MTTWKWVSRYRAALPWSQRAPRSFAFCPPFDSRAASTIVRAHFSHVGTVEVFVLYLWLSFICIYWSGRTLLCLFEWDLCYQLLWYERIKVPSRSCSVKVEWWSSRRLGSSYQISGDHGPCAGELFSFWPRIMSLTFDVLSITVYLINFYMLNAYVCYLIRSVESIYTYLLTTYNHYLYHI